MYALVATISLRLKLQLSLVFTIKYTNTQNTSTVLHLQQNRCFEIDKLALYTRKINKKRLS